MSSSKPAACGRPRDSMEEGEDWFGPGMDLMMSLFSLMIGIMAMVLWQKAHLANRNSSLDKDILELKAKVAETGRGSPFFSEQQWKQALAAKNAEILTLQADVDSQKRMLAELEEKLGLAQEDRKRLEQKISELDARIADSGKNLEEAIRERGDIKLQPIRKVQREVAVGISQVAELTIGPMSDNSISLLNAAGNPVITILNDGYLQTLRFGAATLFKSGSYEVSPDAEKLLATVSMVLARYRAAFKEIQIQGHADTSEPMGTNMQLASNRAMMVYAIFAEHLRPWSNLVSVASYGQYKPVSRVPGIPFDLPDLKRANATNETRGLNRRIEVFLIYSIPE